MKCGWHQHHKRLCDKMSAQVSTLSYISVTSNEGQNHLNWYAYICYNVLSSVTMSIITPRLKETASQTSEHMIKKSLDHIYQNIHFPSVRFFTWNTDKIITRRENPQMIHICYTYRTSSQSSPLHYQPSRTFELLKATLQHNDSQVLAFP